MNEAIPLNPLAFYFTLLMGVLTILLPRTYALAPTIATACYITVGQALDISGLNFTMMRVLIFFCWVRLLVRGEITDFHFNAMDKLLLLWVFSNMAIFIILRKDMDAVINRLGFAYNAVGLYFFFRIMIQNYADIQRIFKIIALAVVPLALAMILEMATGRNIFSLFGGVPEFSMTRDGWVRCQGAFRHPILAGIFGASLLPLFVSLWFQNGKSPLIAACGIVAATAITVASHSSGPFLAFFTGIAGLLLWSFRDHMRIIRWGAASSLVLLHLIMNAPVWYLFAHIGKLTGGTGWHRAFLIDQAVSHINEWWLLGTDYTAHWMPTGLEINPDSADITNQFIAEGVQGGLLTMVLFIILLVQAFRILGKGLALMEDQPFPIQFTLWALGTSLFVHVVSFFSVSYFDQIIVIWYLLLAMISLVASVSEDREHFLEVQEES